MKAEKQAENDEDVEKSQEIRLEEKQVENKINVSISYFTFLIKSVGVHGNYLLIAVLPSCPSPRALDSTKHATGLVPTLYRPFSKTAAFAWRRASYARLSTCFRLQI